MDDTVAAAEKATDAVAAVFAGLSQVTAVVLGGSRAVGRADAGSDIDLYVYTTTEIPVPFRRGLAEGRGRACEIDNRFWEPGDEWDDVEAGVHIDVMYRTPAWAEEELARVLDRHEAQLGYTTCFWNNILAGRTCFDRTGWFAAQQVRAGCPYPDGLVKAIVRKNRPVLRTIASSYKGQLVKAAERDDRVSVNHRTAAFVASYFDVLFAINRTTHPGEKRLLQIAKSLPRVPPLFDLHLTQLLEAAGTAQAHGLADALDRLCDGLDEVASRSDR